jgi:hypothetical protein
MCNQRGDRMGTSQFKLIRDEPIRNVSLLWARTEISIKLSFYLALGPIGILKDAGLKFLLELYA